MQELMDNFRKICDLAKAEQTFIPSRERPPVLAMHFDTAVLLQPGRAYMLGVRIKARCKGQHMGCGLHRALGPRPEPSLLIYAALRLAHALS